MPAKPRLTLVIKDNERFKEIAFKRYGKTPDDGGGSNSRVYLCKLLQDVARGCFTSSGDPDQLWRGPDSVGRMDVIPRGSTTLDELRAILRQSPAIVQYCKIEG